MTLWGISQPIVGHSCDRWEIASNPGASTTVMRANVGSGGMLSIGANYVAYSQVQGDLNVTFHNPNYGQVIPQLVADEQRGLMLDLSFSGDATGSVNLHDLILTRSGKASGTLSGQITAIPEPGTILLLGLGTGLACRLPSKRLT